jgi:outer membrane lipoprotein-sorting protein
MNQRLIWMITAAMIGTCLAGAVLTFAQSAQDVLDRMKANSQSLEDLDATLTVETYSDGQVTASQEIRLSLLQPDHMRQEYLAPDYLAGNLTLVNGDVMWIYIAAADTWFKKDLSELSIAEQPWLVFRQFLRGVQDELDDYSFALDITDEGEEHLVGTAANDQAVYGTIEFWVDPETSTPTIRRLYDVDGNLLVETRLSDVERIGDTLFLARTAKAYDENGELQNVVHYDSITINSGLDPDLFVHVDETSGD